VRKVSGKIKKAREKKGKALSGIMVFEKQTRWLTALEFENLEPVNVFHREGEKAAEETDKSLNNYHMYARRAFRMGAHARRAELIITADDYYKLYINGVYVAQGPAPSYPNAYYVNRIDVLKYLRSGENVIALDVYYQGLNNRVWVSADMRQGFVCELHVDGRVLLRSDEHFHYMRSKSYTTVKTFGYETQDAENFDSRNEPKGWKDTGFDDFMWTACCVKQNHDYTFIWQETPVLETEVIEPVNIVSEGNTTFIDFGCEIAGVLILEASGKAGEKLTIRMGEELEEDKKHVKWQMRCNCDYEDTWILAGSLCEWEMYDYRGFRYAEIISEDGARITSVKARTQNYPLDMNACTLDTTDKNLKDVFELCKHTVKTGVQEGYLDCPTREKGQYSGDLVITSLSQIYLSGDIRLLKKALDDWMRSSFITSGLMAVFPCSFMQEIADYSLLFPTVALRYYEHSGDGEYLLKCFAHCKNILSVYKKYAAEDGLIEHVTEAWNLVDWPQNLRDDYDFELTKPVGEGRHNVINAFYVGAHITTARIAEILGVTYESRIDKLKTSFNDSFLNCETGLYVDTPKSTHSAVHSNILPLFFEIVPEDKVKAVSDYLISQGMRSGVYMAFFLLKALAKAGRYDAVYDLITGSGVHSWRNMLEEGATTLFEAWGVDQKWNTSLCHPWASAPVSVLIEDILGITPDVVKGETWKHHLPDSVSNLKMVVPVMGHTVIFEKGEEGTVIRIEKPEK